jgi:hypothetical protein
MWICQSEIDFATREAIVVVSLWSTCDSAQYHEHSVVVDEKRHVNKLQVGEAKFRLACPLYMWLHDAVHILRNIGVLRPTTLRGSRSALLKHTRPEQRGLHCILVHRV